MTQDLSNLSLPDSQTADATFFYQRFLRVLFRSPGTKLGLLICTLLVLTAIVAPWLAPFDPTEMGVGKSLTPPNGQYWFGTDELGRDLFSRVVYGSRLTLQVGAIAVGISMTIGVFVGVIAGYAGGWIETLFMRAMDVLFSFTETLIALAAVAVLGPSLTNAMVAVGISAIPFYARIAYGAVLVEKNKGYFQAAKAMGAQHLRLIFCHILPNILSPIIVMATVGVSVAVLSASALSFLGLGAQPPSPEWGAILAAGRDYFKRAPWITAFPGGAIAITVLIPVVSQAGWLVVGDIVFGSIFTTPY